MGKTKLTKAQLEAVIYYLPEYELDEDKLESDIIILRTRVQGVPISAQADLLKYSRATVCRRISDLQGYYDAIRQDHPELDLPVRKGSKEEDYMDAH